MPYDAEIIADRRRLRRKLSFWRVASFLALIAAVVVGGLTVAGRPPVGGAQQQIARISVDGFIAGSQRMADLFKRVGEASSVSGVVISIAHSSRISRRAASSRRSPSSIRPPGMFHWP